MTETEYESVLEEILLELSESKAQSERQQIAMNLLSNDAIETFAVFSTSNGCQHSFGIGIAVGVPRGQGQQGDFPSFLAGQRSEEVVVVVWRSQWLALNIRQISIFSPETFRIETEALRTTSEHSHAGEPSAIGVAELRDLMDSVVPLLESAEKHYRASRIRRGGRPDHTLSATIM